MKCTTVKEKAAAIRSELKANDIKGVSVTSAIHGCEECIRVKVKNPSIDLRTVEKIAGKFSKVDYDEYNGELLAGGNTFVQVYYEHGCFDEVREPYMGRALALLAEAAGPCHERGRLFPVNGESGLFMSDEAIRGNGSRLHGGYAPAVAEALYKWDRFGTVAL